MEWEGAQAGVQVRSEPRALRILDPRVLIGQLYVPDGLYYDQRAVQASQRALQSVEAVQWVGTAVEADSVGALRVRYETVLRPPLDVALSVEGFQSTQPLAGNLALPGASLNLRTTYFSLARRGWSLRAQGQAALSYFRQKPDAPPIPLYNLAAEVSLQLPQSSWRLDEAQPRPLPLPSPISTIPSSCRIKISDKLPSPDAMRPSRGVGIPDSPFATSAKKNRSGPLLGSLLWRADSLQSLRRR